MPEHDKLPASFGQRFARMVSIRATGDLGGFLHNVRNFRIKGNLDVPALKASIEAVVARHEALRSTPIGYGPNLKFLLRPPGSVPIQEVSVPTVETATGESSALTSSLMTHENAPFPEDSNSMVRVLLIPVGPQDTILSLVIDHLATDDFSNGIILQEISVLYSDLVSGTAPMKLPTDYWQYRDFVEWERVRLAGDGLTGHQQYWAKALRDARPTVMKQNPTDHSQPCGFRDKLLFGHALLERALLLRKKFGTTLFALLMAVLAQSVAEVMRERDVLFATVLANRARKESANTVGLLANWAYLRVMNADPDDFGGTVAQCTRALVGALRHQEISIPLLPSGLLPQSHASTLSNGIVFQMSAKENRLQLARLDVSPFDRQPYRTLFGLELFATVHEKGIEVEVYYSERVDRSQVGALLNEFRGRLQGISTLI